MLIEKVLKRNFELFKRIYGSFYSIVFLCCVLFFVWGATFYLGNRQLEVYMLDVGQGDSILIRTPGSRFILVDGGPDDEVLNELGEVLPFWVKKIDLVVLTHADSDHVNGLVSVLRRYQVDKVIFSEVEKGSGGYFEFLEEIDNHDIEKLSVYQEDVIKVGETLVFNVIWPKDADCWEHFEGLNDCSVVMRLEKEDFSMLLTGDIENKAEEELVQEEVSSLTSDMLKVGHHGSKTSSTEEFISEVSPQVAMISVGKENKFGHPSEEIVNRLESAGVKLFRTDRDGRIKVTFDGRKVGVRTGKS